MNEVLWIITSDRAGHPEDAEVQPMPRMRQDAEWEQIKAAITQAVKENPLLTV